MATVIGTGTRNAIAAAVAGIFDGGTLEIRTGAPAGPDAAGGGTLLCAIELPDPAFGAPAGGVASMAGVWQGNGVAAGNAGHYRLLPAGDNGAANGASQRLEGTVSGQGGGGDLELVNVSIADGQPVQVSAYTITAPSGA